MIIRQKSLNNAVRISLVSKLVRWIGYLGVVLFLFTELVGGVSLQIYSHAPSSFDTGTDVRNWSDVLARLPFQISVLGGFYWLIRLFGHFQKGDIFTSATAQALKRLSLFVIFIGINRFLQGLYSGLIDLVSTQGATIPVSYTHLTLPTKA